VRALARELAAIWRRTLAPLPEPIRSTSRSLVSLEDPSGCPLYGAVVIRLAGLTVSPLWMQAYLKTVGMRVIHPVVDLTNFLLWDVGQPLHAFDLERLVLPIRVRRARTGETLTLLDGRTLELSEEDLVIADQRGPVALAGVMGGNAAAVTQATRQVLFESAHFAAPVVWRMARRHQAMTDAAEHFGRGTDPAMVGVAASMAVALLGESGSAQAADAVEMAGQMPAAQTVPWDPGRIREILGIEWTDEDIQRALESLTYRVVGNSVEVPSFRHDVETAFDLAEDVARFFGIERVPARLPMEPVHYAARSPYQAFLEQCRDLWAQAGYMEVITRTLTSPEREALLGWAQADPVLITNPLREDERMLRRELLTSLLDVVRHNRSRRDEPVRVFELGAVFARVGHTVQEGWQLAVVDTLEREAVYPPAPEPSLYRLIGIVQWFARRVGWALTLKHDDRAPWFWHPGRVIAIYEQSRCLGWVGEIRPRLAQEFRASRLAAAVLDLPWPVPLKPAEILPPSRYPAVVRDLSLVVPSSMTYQAVAEAMVRDQTQWPELKAFRLIDVYVGEFGRSWTFRLWFQSDRETLTDSEVDGQICRLVAALKAQNVTLRQ
jgi:phenylalanyl-tRNA synthetase beta chain